MSDQDLGKEEFLIQNLETGEITSHFWTDAEYYELMDDDMTIHLPDGSRHERVFKQRKELGKKIPWASPLVSVAAGVHPSQAKEFTEEARAKGFTGVSFNSEGDAVFTTRGQRAAYLRSQGMCDRDACYSD